MDWNNDGKKDLITGEREGYIRIYLNRGTDANPVFTTPTYLQVGGAQFSCGLSSFVCVVDWNNDGRKDVLCGEDNGGVLLLLNVGTDAAPVFDSAVFLNNGASQLTVATRAAPEVVDWNLDGKKDLIVGDANGQLTLFLNRGTDAAPVFNGFELLRAGGQNITVGYYARPAAVDWDKDGRPDLLVGCYDGSSAAPVYYFHNPNGPYLASFAGPGGGVDPGASFNLICWVRNNLAPVAGVQAVLSTTSPWCSITQGEWAVGDVGTGITKSNGAAPFIVRVSADAPLGAPLPLQLSLSGNGGAYRNSSQLAAQVAKPEYSLVDCLIDDSQGNGNCGFDVNERANLVLRLRNYGYRSVNTVARLVSAPAELRMINSRASFGTIERNGVSLSSGAPLVVQPTAALVGSIWLGLEVTCQGGAFTNQLYVTLPPTYPRATNVTYQWLNTTTGTVLTLANNDYEYVDLPFYFPFYDWGIMSVAVMSDGYLCLSGTTVSPSNVAIPNTRAPNAIIAPFWDDLDPSAGGTVRHRTFGTSPNMYWVVEWNQVPRRSDPNTTISCQAILYENGNIKFQYGPSTGTNADGRSATIGIEDPYGTAGNQYSFNRVGAVTNGLALLFRCATGSEDSDADGLPDSFERFYFGNLSATGSQDSDGDGLSNASEFRLGSNPNDASSRLALQPPTLQGPQYSLQWCSAPGRSFDVWQSSTMAPGSWRRINGSPVTPNVSGEAIFTGQREAGGSPVFLRVSVR